jgi:hypothetical protein
LAQPCDRFQQLPARTERQTQRCQIDLGQLRQYLGVDLILAERRHIALKAQTLQPRLDVHAAILGSEERHLHLVRRYRSARRPASGSADIDAPYEVAALSGSDRF